MTMQLRDQRPSHLDLTTTTQADQEPLSQSSFLVDGIFSSSRCRENTNTPPGLVARLREKHLHDGLNKVLQIQTESKDCAATIQRQQRNESAGFGSSSCLLARFRHRRAINALSLVASERDLAGSICFRVQRHGQRRVTSVN